MAAAKHYESILSSDALLRIFIAFIALGLRYIQGDIPNEHEALP